MTWLFHFPFELPRGQTAADVLLDRVASSGTVASVRLAIALAELGQQCVVLDSGAAVSAASGGRDARPPLHAGGVAIEAVSDVAGRFQREGRDAVLVLPPASAMNVLPSLSTARGTVVFWLHNNLAIDLLDRAFAIGLDRAVCVSDPAAATYDAYPWWRRIEAIPYSLRGELPSANPAPEGRRVAFIGATSESKGFHHLLAAWPFVLERVPDAMLHVFGSAALHHPSATMGSSGVMTAEFEARHWRHAANVRFRGSLPRAELCCELQKTRVAVVNPNLTGSTETFCLSAVEAQACGVPVVGAAAQGLLATIADGRSGLLIRSQSPRELADAIVRLLLDDELQRRLAAGAIAHAAQFRSPELEAKRWLAMAERIRSGAPAARSRSISGRLLGTLGIGRAKLALKRRLRPHPDLHD
jgi:glycosyltransferase involved in cell wall biosynthesis